MIRHVALVIGGVCFGITGLIMKWPWYIAPLLVVAVMSLICGAKES